jgi:glycerol-3-phosphate O-acyltransferase/dihydroxyacetone phosphate acyltransferase
LYNPTGTKLPLPRIVELNRRLVQGYIKYQDDPRIQELKKEVNSYNKQLLALHVRDHQVQYARVNFLTCFVLFWYRLLKLMVLTIFVLPGTALFGLVFVLCKYISLVKAREALAASSVKVAARDVMATWKLLVAMVVAPVSYTVYIVLVTYLYSYNNMMGYMPPGIRKRWLVLAQVILYPIVTYAALRFGEVAMDIFKSLGPLLKMMNPWTGNEMIKLKARRERLAERITEIINTLGPEMFDDFYSKRIIQDPFTAPSPPHTPPRKSAATSPTQEPSTFDFPPSSPSTPGSESRGWLPKNESFADLTNQDIFSTRPSTPKRHSRSPSGVLGGFQLKPFSTIDGGNLEEVSQRIKKGIQSGMRMRVGRRSSEGAGAAGASAEGWDGEESEGEEGLSMGGKTR